MLAKSTPRVFRPWPALVLRYSIFHRTQAQFRRFYASITMKGHGDLNNSYAARPQAELVPNPTYSGRSFAISKDDDELDIRERYRPFLLDEACEDADWVALLELSTALKMVEPEIINRGHDRLRILVLYGSMRSRSYSRLLAYECSRILFRLGCDVRVYDPTGLPQKDDIQHICCIR
ncbi:hypothetical protein EDB81DRAFT_771847 [Dactylonectria macrodidyma]|uniref:NADPH-dependent FMN reductase-like domain-containing protein n=1 Tax=Dactylonectria macrodidyma TaxID=307937 RepID=A0A9P9FRT6_9HYPO|nr:hypothetical protein EDB81DRAFT_771847 [Dactylonectria macrodidyma]